jgi:TIR domain
MAKKKVFISYRRDDAAGFSHAIHDRLVEFLPDKRVFMDVHGIESGADFTKRLDAALDQCGVLLVLIGKRWAGSGESGGSRLEDPRDWVRLEVATALRRGVTVIPVLLDGASMPAEGTLPEDLRPLTRLNAVDVRTSRLNADVWDLTGSVMKALGETWPPPEPGAAIYATVSSIYAFLAGAGLLFVLIGSLFMDSVPAATMLATALFLANALVVLRVSIHPRIRDLTRQQALRIGAVLHLVAFGIMALGASDIDGVVVFVFGLVPAAILFLAAFAMQHRGKSSAPLARAAQ